MKNFTYEEYVELIKRLNNNGYKIVKYNEAGKYDKEAILRHDVDMSVEKALEFAKIEEKIGVQSTYYFMLSSCLYNIVNDKVANAIKEIFKMGHSIGIHFDETNYDESINENEVKELIIKEKNIMESILTGINIDSVSMHIPSKRTLNANYSFEEEFVNSYSDRFFYGYKYVSDSEMRWRENIDEILDSGKYDKLHILTHPIWYDEKKVFKEDKILKLLNENKKRIYSEVNKIVPGMEDKVKIMDF